MKSERGGTVFWLAPALPPGSTFLARELDALREVGAQVIPLAPQLGAGAVLAFLRRPLRAVRLCWELQRLKAPLDRERGRIGYAVLFAKGLSLAEELEGRNGRLHACFADGVGTIAYVAASLASRPYSFTAHSPFSLWQGSRLLVRQCASADVVVCQSFGVERRVRDLAGEMATCVVSSPAPPSGVRRRRDSQPHLLLCVGQLIPHKGFHTAVAAVARAVADGVRVELEVIGDGPERSALERLVADLGASAHVRLAGALPNERVLERMSEALALLAPCEVQPDGDRDGLPVSVIDAAACAVPSVATPVSSLQELVVDEVTGLLVAERDVPALAQAIRRLVEDPGLADRLGIAAQRAVLERHDPHLNARRLLGAWGLAGTQEA